MASIAEKLFGTHSDRELKRIMPIVDKIEALDPVMSAMTDEELKAQTPKFKERLAKGETLDDILPEAFATVREASKRVLGMKHFRRADRHRGRWFRFHLRHGERRYG